MQAIETSFAKSVDDNLPKIEASLYETIDRSTRNSAVILRNETDLFLGRFADTMQDASAGAADSISASLKEVATFTRQVCVFCFGCMPMGARSRSPPARLR